MVSPPLSRLPSTTELPCSDDTPVDNEEQNLLPNLLLLALISLWAERMDWYFGVDMAVYHTTGVNPRVPVVPDAFLSLGVERRKVSREGKGRLSYATWEEGGVAPMLTIEMVSQTPGGEYDKKLEIYRRLGVLYYVLYNPWYWKRDRHQPFEVYKLEEGEYRQQIGEPFWMPEIGLGIGRGQQPVGGVEMEVLLWHDEAGQAYPLPESELQELRSQLNKSQSLLSKSQLQLNESQLQRDAAEQKAERLAEYVRSLGLDPDNLPDV